MEMEGLTKYEISRILGARALQIAMNAPLLMKLSKKELEEVNYDSIKIAEIELKSGVLPISVHRPMPEKKEDKLKRVKGRKMTDETIDELESKEEEEIVKDGEIMELANPEDEMEEGKEIETETE